MCASTGHNTGNTPIWFGGGKLASDLTITRLRERWNSGASNPLTVAADKTAVVAVAAEPDNPGALSQAARHMARAAQRRSIIAGMASTFLTVTMAGTASPEASALILAREVGALIDACLVTVTAVHTRREITQASALVRATAETLACQADDQARHVLTQGETMTELTHEEEFLRHLTQAGVLSAQVVQALLGSTKSSRGATSADIAALKAAGYTETTPYDDRLRKLFGEQRWAIYAADPARIVAAAAITDAARAGCDMPALLRRAVIKREWENDGRSPARSLAAVLAYRVTREMSRPSSRRTPASQPAASHSSSKTTVASAPRPPALTPFDSTLRRLLGDQRWQTYADDPRRAVVAELITRAAAEHRDMDALLTHVVESRKFEDDPVSPSRRVAGVLHYRLEKALAGNDFPPRPAPLSNGILDHSKAPANDTPRSPTQVGQPRTVRRHTDERDTR